ncbi:hypothetical protein [Actinoplanes regularis]|uniref:hypothetical protein n=1 Tax=Actinoplanes regularis TaxID=52697 RepID=UPI0024A3944A|nr:hypothetical protein [Actinoplanes regularis]GLW32247.1 hypothetical protein Areg01_51860 [Actinoplanes regularis]
MTKDIEHAVATAVASDFAKHRMIVRLDQGLHRHLVFEAREHSWNDRFELITVPGSLTITGDRGSHTFRRLTDMFQFFRRNGNTYSINPGYWAEKLANGRRSVQVYSEDLLWCRIQEGLREAAEEYRHELMEWRRAGQRPDNQPFLPEKLRRARQRVQDARYWDEVHDESSARNLLCELEDLYVFSDTWEWNLSDWDYHFLHNLHAIAWGIGQYDRAVRLGLHKPRTELIAWDTPLPTEPPAAPAPLKPKGAAVRTTKTLVTAGGVL